MKKLLVATIVILLVAVFMAQASIKRQAQQNLYAIAAELGEVGRLSWDQISLDPRGRIVVHRLQFRLHDSRDPIMADLLVIDGGSIFKLSTLGRDLERGRLPARVRITLSGLTVPVNRASDALFAWFNPGLPFAAASCDSLSQEGLYGLGQLGITELKGELDYRNTWPDQNQLLSVDARLDLNQVGQTQIRLQLRPGQSLSESVDWSLLLANAELVWAEFNFQDQGFYPALFKFCGGSDEQTMATHRSNHLEVWIERWQAFGLEPQPLVMAGYQHFLNRPETITLRFRPESALELGSLVASPMFVLLTETSGEFLFDEGIAAPLTFGQLMEVEASPEPDTPDSPTQAAEPIVLLPAAVSDRQIVVGPAPGWQIIAVSQADRHIGKRAIIEMTDGERHSGRLVQVEDNQIFLSTQLPSGQFARAFEAAEIATMQVRP
jgi:hypothetical protein